MGDCHDDEFRRSQAIHHVIRKPRHEYAAGVTVGGDRRPDFWLGCDEGESGNYRVEELAAEADSASLVPADRFGKFL
jgi:hypothetical protein